MVSGNLNSFLSWFNALPWSQSHTRNWLFYQSQPLFLLNEVSIAKHS